MFTFFLLSVINIIIIIIHMISSACYCSHFELGPQQMHNVTRGNSDHGSIPPNCNAVTRSLCAVEVVLHLGYQSCFLSAPATTYSCACANQRTRDDIWKSSRKMLLSITISVCIAKCAAQCSPLCPDCQEQGIVPTQRPKRST